MASRPAETTTPPKKLSPSNFRSGDGVVPPWGVVDGCAVVMLGLKVVVVGFAVVEGVVGAGVGAGVGVVVGAGVVGFGVVVELLVVVGIGVRVVLVVELEVVVVLSEVSGNGGFSVSPSTLAHIIFVANNDAKTQYIRKFIFQK